MGQSGILTSALGQNGTEKKIKIQKNYHYELYKFNRKGKSKKAVYGQGKGLSMSREESFCELGRGLFMSREEDSL